MEPGLGGSTLWEVIYWGPQPQSTLGLSPMEEYVELSYKTGCKQDPCHADASNLQTGCMSTTVRRIINHITSSPGPCLVIPQEELDMVVDKDIPRIGYQHGQRFS